jgi:hypothetical protein
MNLFQLTALPLFCLFVGILPWDVDMVPSRLTLVSLFLKGLLMFIPAYILLLILKAIVGISYTGFALYASLLARDHLAPLLLGVGSLLLVTRRLAYPATHEGIFLVAFTFLCGYYTLFGPADFLASYGHWGMESLFLLPVMRMSAVLAVAFLAPRFFPWTGRACAAFFSIGAGLTLPLAFASWTSGTNRGWIGAILSALAFLTMAAIFAWRFPRALKDS